MGQSFGKAASAKGEEAGQIALRHEPVTVAQVRRPF
jgi:hypothetical protein